MFSDLLRPRTVVLCLATNMLVGSPQVVRAQEITRDNYINYLPLEEPVMYGSSEENKQLNVWGDITEDDDWDGIAESRAPILAHLAERFAPIMVKNTSYSIPMDVRKLLDRADANRLYVDTWYPWPKISRSEEESQVLHLEGDTTRLNSVILNWIARRREPRVSVNAQSTFNVHYVDLPGEDAETWKQQYAGPLTGKLVPKYAGIEKTYAHPFVVRGPKKSGYELAVQYWFYYPFNDGGNNHEGDWEHINVSITSLDSVGCPLDSATVVKILADSLSHKRLVISRVDYYFHHYVMTLDYVNPANVYASRTRAEWNSTVDRLDHERAGRGWLLKQIWDRVYQGHDQLSDSVSTHPVVYIGGDNQGLDQLLERPGSRNRDSHGSYPLPGRYWGVGPLGATESIGGRLDYWDTDKDVVRFSASNIELLPDWQVIFDELVGDGGIYPADPFGIMLNAWKLVRSGDLDNTLLAERTVKAMRRARRGALFLLPVRFGFPATGSPAAGIVGHADTGNLGALGPFYNSAWNNLGPSKGYESYDPHTHSSVFPLSVQDDFQPRLGFLNFVGVLATVPPFDLLWRLPFAVARLDKSGNDKSFSQTTPPAFRQVGFAVSWRYGVLGGADNLGFMLESPDVQGDDNLTWMNPGDVFTTEDQRSGNVGLEFSMYPGRHLASQHLFAYSNTRLTSSRTTRDGDDHFLSRRLHAIEYVGSLRWNLMIDRFQPYLKAGYGYSWISVERGRKDGFVKCCSPNVFPNTWHYGTGFELVLSRDYRIGGPDIGLRVELEEYVTKYSQPWDEQAFENWLERWMLTMSLSLTY